MRRDSPPLSVLLERFPECRVWLEGGVYLREAVLLHEKGLQGPDDLKGWTRERFLALRGLGLVTLQKIENLLGQELPSSYPDRHVDLERDQNKPLRAVHWRSLGFGTNTAAALAKRGLTLATLKTLEREDFEKIRGVGTHSVALCRSLLGIWPETTSREDDHRLQGNGAT